MANGRNVVCPLCWGVDTCFELILSRTIMGDSRNVVSPLCWGVDACFGLILFRTIMVYCAVVWLDWTWLRLLRSSSETGDSAWCSVLKSKDTQQNKKPTTLKKNNLSHPPLLITLANSERSNISVPFHLSSTETRYRPAIVRANCGTVNNQRIARVSAWV